MKIKLILYIFLCLLGFNLNSYADEVFFDSDNLKIEEEGNMIFATKGFAKIPSQNLEIMGDKFIYNKLISELTIIDNVKIIDKKKNVNIESEKIIYNQIDNSIFSQGKTYIYVEDKYRVNSSNVLYDRNLMKISSNKHTTVNDDNDLNEFRFQEGFLFNIVKEIISSKKTNIIDFNNNYYFFENAKVNLKRNEIVGKEVKIDFIDSFFGNDKNDPILKGKSTTSNNEKTKIYKTVFSTCSLENKKCRGWELQSEEFIHDKIRKLFEYKNSWLKVFNKKVLFLPYFNHPDPSVKRKSGFLTPSYQNSSRLGQSFNIPYFYALSDSKDLTFKPQIYLDNHFIIQSEYREAFENSNLIADFSFNRGEDNTNTHLYADINGKFDDKTEYDLKIQNVSNDNYLKIHDLEKSTLLIDSDSTLTSSFKIDRNIDENTKFNGSFKRYENLSQKDSDRYQYIFPEFNFSKEIEIDPNYNGNFTFLSSGHQKNYDTNIYEAQINNDFNFNSYDFISGSGLVTDYSLLLKNFNTYGKNSTIYDEKNDHKIFGTALIKSEFPLKKKLDNSTNYLKPIIQARFSPTSGKNISSDSFLMDYGAIFSSNRIGRSDMVEKGKSLTLGIEFEKQDLSNDKILGLNVGNVIKDKKNKTLPSKSKLDQTRSDIVGNVFYKLNKNSEISYNFSYDRDLDYSNYESVSAKFGVNNFVTKFDYITEKHDFDDSEVISNETKIEFTSEHSLSFNTTKDLKSDFTQFYNLNYKYETDCLSAYFEYKKKFFSNSQLKPDE
ncbi:hypothetical protein OAI48_02730, partial [Candidatus Pelagibacter sp.]|nr:hypothetical protein [Candidatus Pelagibacter sp.]